jgi:hypothetical protein
MLLRHLKSLAAYKAVPQHIHPRNTILNEDLPSQPGPEADDLIDEG